MAKKKSQGLIPGNRMPKYLIDPKTADMVHVHIVERRLTGKVDPPFVDVDKGVIPMSQQDYRSFKDPRYQKIVNYSLVEIVHDPEFDPKDPVDPEDPAYPKD